MAATTERVLSGRPLDPVGVRLWSTAFGSGIRQGYMNSLLWRHCAHMTLTTYLSISAAGDIPATTVFQLSRHWRPEWGSTWNLKAFTSGSHHEIQPVVKAQELGAERYGHRQEVRVVVEQVGEAADVAEKKRGNDTGGQEEDGGEGSSAKLRKGMRVMRVSLSSWPVVHIELQERLESCLKSSSIVRYLCTTTHSSISTLWVFNRTSVPNAITRSSFASTAAFNPRWSKESVRNASHPRYVHIKLSSPPLLPPLGTPYIPATGLGQSDQSHHKTLFHQDARCASPKRVLSRLLPAIQSLQAALLG